MRLFSVLKKGAVKTAGSYKLLITMWVITLGMILLVAMPLKLGLKIIFSKSFATDRLLDGFDAGLVGDMGTAFNNLLGSATYGGFLLLIAGFLLYTFFAGGLFACYNRSHGSFKVAEFLKSSAHYFVTFLGIGIIMIMIILVWTLVIIGIPAAIAGSASKEPLTVMTISKIMTVVWLLGLPLWFLVADRARIWVATTGIRRVFRALGEGFTSLHIRFKVSYPAMLIVFLVNMIFLGMVFAFTAGTLPEKGLLISLFFFATQLLVVLRIYLKAWRYATVSVLAQGSVEPQ